MPTSRTSTRSAALAAFLLFAAALFDVSPAEASRTSDARSGLAPTSAKASLPPSLGLASLELSLLAPVESSPRFGFAEDLSLLDVEARPCGFELFGGVGTRRCALTYARNNPLKYVDPDGRELRLTGSDSARGTFASVANAGLYGQQVAIAASGTVSMTSSGMHGPPSPGQAAMASVLSQAIGSGLTQIDLVENSTNTYIGNFRPGGTGGEIDVADVAKLGNGPGLSGAGAIGHEVAEQFAKQTLGITNFDQAHRQGVAAENNVNGMTRVDLPTAFLGGGRLTLGYSFNGPKRNVQVYVDVKDQNVLGVERVAN